MSQLRPDRNFSGAADSSESHCAFAGTPLLALLLAAFIAGIIAADYGPALPLPLLWPFVLATVWLPLRRTRAGLPLLLGLFVVLAWAQYQRQLAPPLPAHHVAHLDNNSVHTIEGRIREIHQTDSLRIDLETEHLFTGVTATPLCGRLRLSTGEGEADLRVGQRIRFRGRLRKPVPFGTPGEFNYPRYLANRKIFATAYVDRAELIVPLARDGPFTSGQRIGALRRHIGQRIDHAVGNERSALVRALVIGDRQLKPELRRKLSHSGLSHLFALSGLHLGLLGLFLYLIGNSLYRRSEHLLLLAPPGRLLPLLLLPPLWFYLQLSGNALSTQRAFSMAVIAALLLFFGRRTRPLQTLMAVALLLLCGTPLVFFEPAWQLSMAGVTGILLFLPAWQKRLSKCPCWIRWPCEMAATTLAATLATAPVILGHFHLLAPAGLLGNLLAVPLIGFGAVPLGLAGALIDPLFPSAGAALYRLCGSLCEAALQGGDLVARIPWLAPRTLYLPPRRLLGAGLLALTLLLPRRPGRLRWLPLPLLMTALLLLLLPARSPRTLTLTSLSVGHGDALLLSCPERGHYLIDGGGFYGSNFDVGARLVAPALARLGVDSLEAVLLTHDHPDHRLGLVEILNHFPVKAFWSGLSLEELHQDLREPLLRRNIPWRTFEPGWTLLDRNETGSLSLHTPCQRQTRVNDRSLALYLHQGRDGLLLTGDLELQGVVDLLQKPPQGPVTLLQIPHHGSRYSEPWRLVAALQPEQVFASTGRQNRYGLPHVEVIAILAEQQLALHHTGREGSLQFRSDGDGWRLRRWHKGLFR